jgi:hypothetical protein
VSKDVGRCGCVTAGSEICSLDREASSYRTSLSGLCGGLLKAKTADSHPAQRLPVAKESLERLNGLVELVLETEGCSGLAAERKPQQYRIE